MKSIIRKLLISFCAATLASFTANAQLTNSDLVINEILASNSAAYTVGPRNETPDVIELRNLTGSVLDLSGYGLSDDDSSARWILPAGTMLPASGYLIIQANGEANGLETDFKLSAGGERVQLADPSGAIVDEVTFGRQRTDVSFGRLQDGSFAFFPNVTIGAANDDSSALLSLTDRPSIDQESGIYTNNLTVTLTAEQGAEIRYTLNASRPNASSPLYSGPITITDTTVLKAIAINQGFISETASRTFLFNVSHDLPVVILTADNFFDRRFLAGQDAISPDEGIYSFFDIDGRVRFDFLETDGSLPISQYTEFRKSGRNSLFRPPLNGKIIATPKFGKDSLNHRFFPEKIGQNKFSRLLLRNTSQDFASARLRDGIFSRILSTDNLVDVDYEGYRPSVLYLNGRYMGHVNLREDDDQDFVDQYFDFSSPVIRRRRSGGGNIFLWSGRGLPNITDPDVIERLNDVRRVDESLLDDALRDSMSLARRDRFVSTWVPESGSNEAIRSSFHDYDLSFKLSDQIQDSDFSPPTVWDTISWPGILNRTGTHARYWEESVQYTAAYLNLFATPDRLERIIDDASAEIRSEMPRTIQFYEERRIEVGRPMGPDFNPTEGLVPQTMAEWENEVAFIRSSPRLRVTGALDAIKATHSLPELIELDISSSNSSMGDVRVHGIKVSLGSEIGRYFSTFPVRLVAEPKAGHTFVRWEGDIADTNASIRPSFTTDSTIRAVFASTGTTGATAGNIAISEIFYNPLGTSEDDEFIELTNISSSSIDLSNLQFIQGITYTFPTGTTLAAGARIVIRPTDYQRNLSNDGEQLTLIDANGALIESLTYGDGDPWPEAADGLGHSLVRISPEDSSAPSSPSSWRLSTAVGGNPGTSDSIPLTDTSISGLLDYTFGEDGPMIGSELTSTGLTLFFTKQIAADDVRISLFQSPNLQPGNWSEMTDPVFLSESLPVGGRETITVESIPTDDVRSFYRLEVNER